MADKKVALDLEVNIKKGDISMGELNEQIKQINATLLESQTLLVEFRDELAKLEQQRAAILSQGTISSQEYIEQQKLNVEIKNVNGSIDSQKRAISKLSNEKKTLIGSIKQLAGESTNYNKLIQAGDKLTGGKVTKIVKLYKGFKEGAKAIKIFNMGLSGMKKALIATGIGALVVALGVIVAYWDDIVGFINGASAEQNKLLEDTEKTKVASQEALAVTEASENSLRLQGMSEKEILDLKIKQTDAIIAATEEQLLQQKLMKDSQLAAAERNQKIAAGVIGFLNAPIVLLLGAVDALTYGLSKVSSVEATSLAEGFVMGGAAMIGFDADELKKEGDAIEKEAEKQLIALRNKRDGFKLRGQADDKKAADKLKQNKEKETEEENRLAKEKADALEAIRVGEIDTDAERRQEELDKIDKYYDELITKAKEYGKNTSELEDAREAKKKELFDKQAARDAKEQAKKDKATLKAQETFIEKLEADKEQDELTFEQRREDIARREAIFLEDKTLTETQRNEVEANFSKERSNLEKGEAEARIELNQQRVDLALATLGALNGLVQAFAKDDEESQKKAFNANKAFGIAQAIISTAQGISTQLGVPQDQLTGANFIKAGIVAATGAAQIATISKTQFKGAATPPTPPPSGNVEGDVGFAPRGFTSPVVDVNAPTTKVIVTETDIRNVSRNVDGVYSRATVVQ
tara:strand:- start:1628 stop:3709 length:2082 start_codon:yes stop_codon:yes gene_type:complete